MQKHKTLLLAAILIIAGITAKAQDIYSPFSIQGLGQLQNQNQVHVIGQGGVGIGLSDSIRFSLKNPATSSYLRFTTFEMSAKANFNTVNSPIGSGNYNNIGFNYMALGFPLSKKHGWAAVFGILPYSSYGFRSFTDSTGVGRSEGHLFSGSTSKAFLNVAGRVVKNLSFGVQVGYLFGKLSYRHSIDYPYSSENANTQSDNSFQINGLNINGGLHYKKRVYDTIKVYTTPDSTKFKKIVKYLGTLELGFTYNSAGFNKTKIERFAVSYINLGSSITIPDTVLPFSSSTQSFSLPVGLGFGLLYSFNYKYRIGLDIETTNWSNFDFPLTFYKPSNALSISFGGTYLNSLQSNSSFLARTEFRAGMNYTQSYLSLSDKQLNSKSLSFGIGLPIRKTQSRINFGMEMGGIGNSNTEINENFVNFYLGFTVNEQWFNKRKIN